MKVKVAELRGYKSLKALNAFHTLMLGLKMLPSYMLEDYESFFKRIQEMPPIDQERMIREAALFVELQKDEVESLLCFCSDPNGVPYTAENLNTLKPNEIIEIIVAVSKEIAQIRINFVTEAEKKN